MLKDSSRVAFMTFTPDAKHMSNQGANTDGRNAYECAA